MKVCIAEKPSVAREIAFILGASQRKDGYLEGNGYAVTWTFGHFCGLKAPDDYRADWKKWDLHSLPMLPEKFETKLMKDKGVRKQFAVIKKLFQSASLVINCGDAGQEGELIQRWVIKESKYKGPVQRLWISSLTAESIRKGFQNLKNAADYDDLFFAGSARAIGDWLLGMNATRLYTLKYGGYKQVLSVGRVQTPTLAMIVKRHWEIERFVSKPFWELKTIYRGTSFQLISGKFDKKEDGEAILKKITGQPFVILSVQKKPGKEYAKRLFDLTGLQVYCNSRFGFSADKTLKIAQKLYEQKLITYPRVDTTYLPNDVYPKCPGILQKMTQYAKFTAPLANSKLRKPKRVFDDKKITDHHAIIPTGYESHLTADFQKVYDIIARRFIAIFYPDCEFNTTEVKGETAKLKFKTTGKEITKEGWKVLFPKKKNTNSDNKKEGASNKKDEDEKILPSFVVGESGPHKPHLSEGKTHPPKYHTEATLLKAMETAGKVVDDEELSALMKENGIGRPSTRAAIIETLFRRKYIQRQKRYLVPTETGLALMEVIQNQLLKSPELTGHWEKKLRQIEAGKYSAKIFVDEMKNMLLEIVTEVKKLPSGKRITAFSGDRKTSIAKNKKAGSASSNKKENLKKSKAESVEELVCPKCKRGKILKGSTAYGCGNFASGCNFRLPFKMYDKRISEKQVIRLIDKGSTVKLKGFLRDGLKCEGKLVLRPNADIYLEALGQNPIPKKTARTVSQTSKSSSPKITCPICKKGSIIKGKGAFGCSEWKAGCSYRFKFEDVRVKSGGKKLNRTELVQLLLEEY